MGLLLNRFKVRLVAKGFTQTYGVDYRETFASVAKLNSIKVLISLAANLDWPLQQLDIKNVFLNGELEEEVYMDVPPGIDAKVYSRPSKRNGNVGMQTSIGTYGSTRKVSNEGWQVD